MLNNYEFSVNNFENITGYEYRKKTNKSHIFHSIEWMKIIKEALGVNHKIAILKENNQIVASIPFAFSRNLMKGPCALPLQFTGYYNSILADNNIIKAEILTKFYQYCKEHGLYTQLPETNEIKDFKSFFGYSIYKLKLEVGKSVEEQILNCNNKRMRNYTKNAIKSELVTLKGGQELLNKFYSLHLQNMKELGTPPFPKIYFKKIFQFLPKITKIILVMNQDQVCSGVMVLKITETELLTLNICTPRLFSTGLSSYLIYLEAAKLAQKWGCSIINFGRSIDGTGPALFKKRYGLEVTPLKMYSPDKNWTVTDPRNSSWRHAIRIWKKLPISVTKLGGLFLAKNII